MRRLLATLCLIVAAGGTATAEPAMTNAPTRMRESPSPQARVVQEIPANAQIDVQGCGRVWCSASWRDISGFVAVRSVSLDDAGPLVDAPPPRPVYVGPPVVVAPCGFGWGYGWRHY